MKDFCHQIGLDRQREREQSLGFSRSSAQKAVQAATKHYQTWLHDIGANDGTAPKTLADYYVAKHNDAPVYQLLKGYSRAVDKGDISPLVGFKRYNEVAQEIEDKLIGVTTSTGVTIESFATHFIDRTIGQTSTAHKGMRLGTDIEHVLDALTNPVDVGKKRTMKDGDIRQKFTGKNANVVISTRDKKLIQANPRRAR